MTCKLLALAAAALLMPAAAPAAGPPPLEQIMADPAWIGETPERPWWALDGRSAYYFVDRAHGEIGQELVQVDLRGRRLATVDEARRSAIPPRDREWDPDRRRVVYEHHGDLFVMARGDDAPRQLTRTDARESDPRWVDGGRAVAFRRGDALLVRELEGGLEYELARWSFDDPPAPDEEEGYLDEQQERLLDIVRQWKAQEDARRELDTHLAAEDPLRLAEPFYLGEGQELVWASAAPDLSWVALLTRDAKLDRGRPDTMPNYISEDGYTSTRELRPKVGTGDPYGEELWVLDLASGEAKQVDRATLPEVLVDRLGQLRHEAYGDTLPAPLEEPRPVGWSGMAWRPGGGELLLQGYSFDNKDRWIVTLGRDGELDLVEHYHEPAWVNWDFREAGWLGEGPGIWYTSEASGHGQLYSVERAGAAARALTAGEFRASDVQASPDGRWLYFRANPQHPGRYELHRVRADGSAPMQALTSLGGNVDGPVLSPDGERVLFLGHSLTRPPELYLVDAGGGEARRLTDSTSDAFDAVEWVRPEIVAVPSTHHDRPIHSRLYLPPPGAPAPPAGEGRPAVLFVHGAGYLQNSHFGWSSYFREFMFHSHLARRGVVVLDMDYRASEGYGRAWRTAIYRHMGGPELEDLDDGLQWLVDEHGVDPGRVGIYGGSYGGFLAFMGLFTRPGQYAAGAALRPVSDWAHYNHPYTSNILNTPQVDPDAYARSSPIEFAEGLADPLLICAPMQDDNVFFMDVVRLAQRLIELEKEDWEVAIFPVEPHGFREPSSWLNEYRRILALFEDELGLAPLAGGE